MIQILLSLFSHFEPEKIKEKKTPVIHNMLDIAIAYGKKT